MEPLLPTVVPGPLQPANVGSLDVSFQRLAAYGVGSTVVVMDASTGSIVQTLDSHPGAVCRTRWSSRALDTNLDREYKLLLASGDVLGNVMVWSVVEGHAELHLTDAPMGAVLDMRWHPSSWQLLLTLREPNVLALWDASKGASVWRRAFKHVDECVCLLFGAVTAVPPVQEAFFATRKGWVYRVPDVSDGAAADAALLYKIAAPDPKSSFLAMHVSPALPGCMAFVLSREVLVFDVATSHPVGGLALERGMAALVSVSFAPSEAGLACWGLHEDGRLSLWRAVAPAHLSFALLAVSAPLRFAKTRRLEPQPLVAALAVPGVVPGCVAMDRLGVVTLWGCDAGVVHASAMHPSLLCGVTSVAVHPTRGGRLVACGTAQGTLALVDAEQRAVVREVLIDSGQAVRGVQWCDADTVLVFVVQEVQSETVWINSVQRVTLSTGRVAPLLSPTKRPEPTLLRTVRLSPSGRYLLALRKDRPLELWDLRPGGGEAGNGGPAHLGSIKPYVHVNAVAWLSGPPVDGAGDEFATATADNVIRTFRVDQGKLALVRQQEALSVSPVSSLAWQGDLLAAGDASGGLSCFDWKRKVCWTVNTRGAAICELRWNPSSPTVLVLFASGAVCVYDMLSKRQVCESGLLSVRGIRATDVGWASPDVALLATSDGSLRLLDAQLASCNAPFRPRGPVYSPHLLDARAALVVKARLLGQRLQSDEVLATVPGEVLRSVASAERSAAERGLAVARFFGDVFEETVWRYVLGLAGEQAPAAAVDGGAAAAAAAEAAPVASAVPVHLGERGRARSFLLEHGGDAGVEQVVGAGALGGQRRPPLPSQFGLLRDAEDVKEQHLAQTLALEQRRSDADVATFHAVAARFVQHGDRHDAIRTLTSSDPAWPSFDRDSLLACVVAAASGPEYFTRTTKMAATGLIARGDVDLGVQLLVLVGKADEAARYLREAGRWEDAVRLAKLQLPPSAQADLLRRWADHLVEARDELRAVLVLLSLGNLARVATLLHGMDRFTLALELLRHFAGAEGGVQLPDEVMRQSLCLDNGFFLHRLGLDGEATELFEMAGPAGQQMVEALSSRAPFDLQKGARTRSGSGAATTVPASKRSLLAVLRDEVAK